MSKAKVLFMCIHNSARSQMAEAYLNKLAGDKFEAESAGLEAGTLNHLVIEAMKEDGIDISHNKTKEVFDLFKKGKHYQYVITVCDEASAEKCPFFPSQREKANWSFPDPSGFEGTYEEKLSQVRTIRDAIKKKVVEFISTK